MRERLLHYRLLEKLGAGGMGEVYRAQDTRLGREVALKILPDFLAQDQERLSRFEREARTLAALSHPNIVTLHSFEEEAGVRFLTMELVRGSTLGSQIPQGGLSLPRLFEWAAAICEALAAAHEKGILHRDLKPANVMLDEYSRVKVLDFGLAKLEASAGSAEETTASVTQAGVLVGTVPYMSPEQIQGRSLDARSDLFSLGILLYEMATGCRPFGGGNALEILSAILKETPRPPSSLKPELPPRLEALLEKCLEKEPNARPQTALELREELLLLQKESLTPRHRPSPRAQRSARPRPAPKPGAQATPPPAGPGARWLRCDLRASLAPAAGGSAVEALESLRGKRADQLASLAESLVEEWRGGEAPLDLLALVGGSGVEAYKRLRPFFDAIGERAKDEGWRLPAILPSVELWLGEADSCRLQLVFGAAAPIPAIEELLGRLFEGRPAGPRRGLGIGPREALRRIEEFCRPPDAARPLEYVALIGEPAKGAQPLQLGPEKKDKPKEMPWHGWICGEEPSAALRDWIWQWTPEPARRDGHWPLIQASDGESRGFCWLKAEIADVEGIRLALMDPESRLRRRKAGPPGASYPMIRGVRLRKTDFFEELQLPLAPGLTTLIGGRGSGKSTVIECLRFVLDRARASDFQENENAVLEGVNAFRANRKKARDFGESPGIFLPGHEIHAELTVAGQNYEVLLASDGIPKVRLQGEAEPSGLDVRALLAPRILSQGQIAQIARDPAAQRRELDALLPPGELRLFEEQRQACLDELRRLQAMRDQLETKQASLPMRETELKKLQDQIDWLEQGGSQELLDEFHELQRQKLWLEELAASLQALEAMLERQADETRRKAHGLDQLPPGSNQAWLTGVARKSQKSLRELAGALQKQGRQLSALGAVLQDERAASWEPVFQDVSLRYAALSRELEAKGLDFGQHARLLEQRSSLEREITELKELQTAIDRLRDEWSRTRERLTRLCEQRLARRRSLAHALEEQNADIRMEIDGFADRKGLLAQRERWFAGTGFREQDWELLVDFVYAGAPVPERLQAVAAALRADVREARMSGAPLTSARSRVAQLLGPDKSARLSRHFYNALLQGDRIRLDEMELYLPEDQVEARARAADGSFKPITQGSIGQRGTAILSLLLSSGDQPLIIDQPEDDLDNQYVYTAVVRLLRKQKFTRQLLIATHNANIPVNGDAELIIALGVQEGERLGCVLAAGSIDRPEVKAQVSSIMEGSAEAFRLRGERYGY